MATQIHSKKLGNGATIGIQFINETEAIIRGVDGYYGNNSDSESELKSDTNGPNMTRIAPLPGVKYVESPKPGKKTRGRVKIDMKFIENKLRRYTTFSKRKTGIMKKAYELSTLTGTQVMLLVASETGHVYTFATRKLQPMITSETGKALIQTCLNSPDGSSSPIHSSSDQRMNVSAFDEADASTSADNTTENYNCFADEVTTDEALTKRRKLQTDADRTCSPRPVYIVDNYQVDETRTAIVSTNEPTVITTTSAPVAKILVANENVGLGGLLGVPKNDKSLIGVPQGMQLGNSTQRSGNINESSPNTASQISTSDQNIQHAVSQYTDLKPAFNSQTVAVGSQQFHSLTNEQLQALTQQHILLQQQQQAQSSSVNTTQVSGSLLYQTPGAMLFASATTEGGVMLALPQDQSLKNMQLQFSTIQVPVTMPDGQTQIIQLPVQQAVSASGNTGEVLVSKPSATTAQHQFN